VIQLAGTVTYHDGQQAAFAGGPREWVMWEQYALGRGLPTVAPEPGRAAALTMVWYLAWACATRGQNPRPGFDPWLDSIAEVADFELVDAPPIPLDRSHAESSSSPSPAASRPPSSTASSRASSPP
jgi:hypothetical protein